jgi:hypothetical protein
VSRTRVAVVGARAHACVDWRLAEIMQRGVGTQPQANEPQAASASDLKPSFHVGPWPSINTSLPDCVSPAFADRASDAVPATPHVECDRGRAPLGDPALVVFGDLTIQPSKQCEHIRLLQGPPESYTAPQQKLQSLAAVSASSISGQSMPLYPLPHRLQLVEFLLDHLRRLHLGTFPINGQHARLIVGAKGIGKSTMLKQAVTVAEALYPNVISVYVSYKDAHKDHVMLEVCRHLASRGLVDDASVKVAAHPVECRRLVLSALKRSGKRLFLVVDELDEVYRLKYAERPVEAGAGVSTLYSLSSLGSHSGDCTAVLLCGSSSLLPLLISRKEDAGMRISHPNVGGAPNLNGTKFKRLRVHGGLPTDLVSAVVACAEFRRKQSLASTDSIARLALFSAGSNMKLLETAALKGSVTPEERLESFGNQPLSELSADFHRAIMAELRVANKALIVALCDPVTKKLDADRVASMKWESELQPVPRSVLERVWSTVSGQRLDPTLGVGVLALEIEIHRLVDGGHLTADFQHSFFDGVPVFQRRCTLPLHLPCS